MNCEKTDCCSSSNLQRVVPHMNPMLHRSRTHVRYLCSTVAEMRVTTGAVAGASYVALITDVCVNGMRVSMDGPIAVDSQVVVTALGQLELVGTVRHVRQNG